MPQDKNGRRHCYSCGHFIGGRNYYNDTCSKCKDKHDDARENRVKVCGCGKMFKEWTYNYRKNLRKAGNSDSWTGHYKECNGGPKWILVKHEDLSNAEILSGKVLRDLR